MGEESDLPISLDIEKGRAYKKVCYFPKLGLLLAQLMKKEGPYFCSELASLSRLIQTHSGF